MSYVIPLQNQLIMKKENSSFLWNLKIATRIPIFKVIIGGAHIILSPKRSNQSLITK